MQNNTPRREWLPKAYRPLRGLLPFSLLCAGVLAALTAGFAAADLAEEGDSDTLQVRTRSIIRSDDGHIEIQTSLDGARSGITIRGDTSRPRWSAGSSGAVRSSEMVRVGGSVTILENQTIDGDAVAVMGDVTVYGRVEGNAVAVLGTVFIRDGGVVEGDAVGIGGGVRKDPGARVGGENVQISIVPGWAIGTGSPGWFRPLFGASSIILVLLLLFLLGWLFLALGESRVRRVGVHVQEHLWKSLLTGMAAAILSPFAFVLLLITVVGIPLALMLPVVIPLAQLIGFLIVAGVVGMRLASRTGTSRSDLTYGLALGLLFFIGILLVGQLARIGPDPLRFFGIILTVFGLAASLVAGTIGLGALILSRFGRAPRPPVEKKAPVQTPLAPGSPEDTHPLTTG